MSTTTYPDLLEANGYWPGMTCKGWGPGSLEASGRSRNPAGPAFNERKCQPPTSTMSTNDYAAKKCEICGLGILSCGMRHTAAMFNAMKLKRLAEVRPGHLNRARIRPSDTGSHGLVQVRNVEAGILDCREADITRFNPNLSSRDVMLQDGDILFMARGVNNYAALLAAVPESALAAASFFIVRASREKVDPGYLAWFMNQPRAQHYFSRRSGRNVHMPVVRRAVLESLEVPVPPWATQNRIGELFRLSLDEKELTNALMSKRQHLVDAVCLNAAEK